MALLPPSGPYSRSQRILITVPVLMASLLHAVNMSTAYVALPNIQGNLSATPDQVGWIITAFVVASAVGTVLTGWLAQQIGRRAVFLGAIAGFTATSLLCASAADLQQLVLFRILQGLVSAPLLPVSQSIMLDTYPREKHGFAMSIWSMGMILGPVIGPTIGAIVTEYYGWRYLFLINIPLGLAAFFAILPTLPKAPHRPGGLDWIGVTSLIVAVSFFQLMLDRGERQDWFESTEIIIEACVAALAMYVFVVHSMTARNPYINLAIFQDRNYVIGCCLIFVFGVAVFSSLFVLPLFLQNIQGYPVISAGWVVSARGVGTMFAMLSGGFLADRFQARHLILIGLVCVGASNYVMTGWSAEVGIDQILLVTLVNGFGMGVMWVTLSTVTFSTLAPEHRVEGASLFALIRAIGASVGTSVIVMILVRSSQINYSELRDRIHWGNEALRALGDSAPWSLETAAGVAALGRLVAREAMMIAFLNDFVFLVAIAVVAVPLVFLLRRPPKAA
ncbi:MAG: DHA2 family efflux MFS transporter permease subunit [Alphaproteobacteria bacterium]